MDLLTTLVLGSYMYTSAVFIWFQKKYDKLATNHLKHLVAIEVQRQMELAGSQVDIRAERNDIVDDVD